ncbi:hypothetical protein LTR53_013242 [Teratosphaeriaceae sp. CCFEE 6253]|nr:hypothetical protein LTR53_013242 [Teratosphaeriaceae sp. CCFEE 6253]
MCRFVVRPRHDYLPSGKLALLLANTDDTTAISLTSTSETIAKTFNLPELRMAMFSLLSARDLLRVIQVCRSWYRTVALERKLQQRLFLTAGPGELVMAARQGTDLIPAIQPRNTSQLEHMKMTKSPAMSGPGPLHITINCAGAKEEVSAARLEADGIPIILNPFFTSIWPQDPTNMTSSPHGTAPATPISASWRRMQLTSPPVTRVDMHLWYTKKSKGGQLLPSTGYVPTGVTLGDVADVLADQPRKFMTLHWIQIMSHAWWVRSADAVVVPEEGTGGNNEARAGVYVNPSNGIAFPGAF